jgi:hypothetical protein
VYDKEAEMGENGPKHAASIEGGLHAATLDATPDPFGWYRLKDPHHAFNPRTGQEARYDVENEKWIDQKTGLPFSGSESPPFN